MRRTPRRAWQIEQVADVHFGESEGEESGPRQDRESKDGLRLVMALEKPSLVVLSGDQLTGLNIHRNATAYWDEVVGVFGHVPHTATPLTTTPPHHHPTTPCSHRHHTVRIDRAESMKELKK